MEIKNQLPPNYDEIRLAINPPHDAVFCFGDTLYTLSQDKIPEDILHHESIHKKQQGKDIDAWWNKWITNKDFRYQQELQAYVEQYDFIKKNYNAKAAKEALSELAHNLSTLYGLSLNPHQVETAIRHNVKLL